MVGIIQRTPRKKTWSSSGTETTPTTNPKKATSIPPSSDSRKRRRTPSCPKPCCGLGVGGVLYLPRRGEIATEARKALTPWTTCMLVTTL